MTPPPFRAERYAWGGGEEHALLYGPPGAPLILWSPALLEEANRTRALVADVCRRLGSRGIACAVPDLPGQNESLHPLDRVSPAMWEDALSAAARAFSAAAVAAVRGGALVRGPDLPRWHLSPQGGPDLAREWSRLAAASGRAGDVAGNRVSPELAAGLAAAHAPPARIVRLGADPRRADLHLDRPPPWRRSEPAADPALADALARDLAAWIAPCGV